MLRDTCVQCHNTWSQDEAEYQVDAIQNYTRGKMRKAEYWLGVFIDTYTRAKDAGVRKRFSRKPVPFTTRPTSSGNGGPLKTAMASTIPGGEGIAGPVDQRLPGGIKLLEKAIEEKRK